MKIDISKPSIGEREKEAMIAVLESGQLTQGAKVAEFEQAFAAYHGAKYGIATSNGTSALVSTIMAYQIGAGDEVIVPSFSFFATASCLLATGAVPVFADIDPVTYNMSVESAEACITPRTKAIMPVHMFGYPADMDGFSRLCERYGLLLLEDAAQAHGAAIGDRFVSSWGTAAFSFYATKNMTTCEGGMVLTNDAAVAGRLKMVRQHGMNSQYFHEMLGFNFRMTNLSAALGLVQLEQLDGWTDTRIANAQYFNKHITTVQTPHADENYRHVYHQYTVRVPEGLNRDDVLETLKNKGIHARVYYPLPIHQQPIFCTQPRYQGVHLPETERAARQVLSLPVHPALTLEERDYIVDAMNALVE